jgi:hypothetical protein
VSSEHAGWNDFIIEFQFRYKYVPPIAINAMTIIVAASFIGVNLTKELPDFLVLDLAMN